MEVLIAFILHANVLGIYVYFCPNKFCILGFIFLGWHVAVLHLQHPRLSEHATCRFVQEGHAGPYFPMAMSNRDKTIIYFCDLHSVPVVLGEKEGGSSFYLKRTVITIYFILCLLILGLQLFSGVAAGKRFLRPHHQNNLVIHQIFRLNCWDL